MNKYLFFYLPCIFLISCRGSHKDQPNSGAFAKMELLKADRDFSKNSEEKGMKMAFMEYLDSNGVLLRANRLPIAGADAIDFLLQQNDTDYTLTWEPRSGAVAKSGELGYTYGIYALRPSTNDTVIYGTYVRVWEKEKNGTWRYVLDSRNEGIGEMRDSRE